VEHASAETNRQPDGSGSVESDRHSLRNGEGRLRFTYRTVTVRVSAMSAEEVPIISLIGSASTTKAPRAVFQ